MHRHILRPLAVAAVFLPLGALAGHPLEVEIFDRTMGRVLPVYWHEGERHVAGEPGHEYEIRIRNRSHGRVDIDGWRKSLDEVAAFYFTRLPDSYAARTGRPDNVGVIGVAMFREREESRLGTGHGRRLDSGARYTHFERARREPDQIIRIFYDSKRNLVARGVIPRSQHRLAHRPPEGTFTLIAAARNNARSAAIKVNVPLMSCRPSCCSETTPT